MDAFSWILTSLLVFLASYLFATRSKKGWIGMPPAVSGSLPVIGHALKLREPFIYAEWRQKHGDVYTINIAGQDTVVVHDLDLIKSCLRAEELGFLELIERSFKFDEEVMARQTAARSIQSTSIAKATIFSRIASAEPTIVNSCKALVDKQLAASPSGSFEMGIKDLAKLIVGDATGRVVFQLVLPIEFYNECSRLEVVQMKAFQTMAPISIDNKYFKRWVYKDYVAGLRSVHERFLKTVVQDHRKNPGRSVFIDALVNMKPEDDKTGFGAYDDLEISTLIVGIVLASMANTTLLTTHVISTLMRDRTYFERVRDEVCAVQDLKGSTPVLEALVYECARMACVTTGSLRLAIQDLKLSYKEQEFIIPTGASVLLPHYTKNYNPELFSDPTTFNPERFLTLKEKKSDVMNWGGGIHMCPGKNLALSEAKVIAATLLQNYDVTPKNLDKYGKMVWCMAGTAISPMDGTNVVTIKNKK